MKGLKHRGGEEAKKGTYWNFSNGDRVIMEKDGVLPGDRQATYYKGHPIFVLMAAPILGLVYAVFLPFIGIAAVITMVGRKLMGGLAHEASKAASFGWRPAEAYLSGKEKKKEGEAETPEDSKEEVA